LKQGWKRYWPFVSALATCTVLATAAQAPPRRANELTLAGLRPGKNTLEDARHRLSGLVELIHEESTVHWFRTCTGASLKLETDENDVIQTITFSLLDGAQPECPGPKARERWQTGRGLKLGDPCSRAAELYGKAASSGPSVQGGRELKFFFYAFDWAGSDVPQVMEVICDPAARDRVVQITLAFPSL
jgi:hypothetical protein